MGFESRYFGIIMSMKHFIITCCVALLLSSCTQTSTEVTKSEDQSSEKIVPTQQWRSLIGLDLAAVNNAIGTAYHLSAYPYETANTIEVFEYSQKTIDLLKEKPNAFIVWGTWIVDSPDYLLELYFQAEGNRLICYDGELHPRTEVRKRDWWSHIQWYVPLLPDFCSVLYGDNVKWPRTAYVSVFSSEEAALEYRKHLEELEQ